MNAPKIVSYRGAKYVLAETHKWTKVGTKSFSGRGRTGTFSGSATLYKYAGDNAKAAYGAVVTGLKSEASPSGLIAGNSGGIMDAIAKAFGLKGVKLPGAKGTYSNWGAPIGTPSDNKGWEKGNATFVWFKK